MNAPCHCKSGVPFDVCCGPYLRGIAEPRTAQALMRSRYAAFCAGDVEYLVNSRAMATRAPDERAALRKTIASTEFRNLLIVGARRGGEGDETGEVTFVAAFRARSPAPMLVAASPVPFSQLHERSRFVREDGAWRYLDGDRLAPLRQKRNAACWCGSGRKAKECHPAGG